MDFTLECSLAWSELIISTCSIDALRDTSRWLDNLRAQFSESYRRYTAAENSGTAVATGSLQLQHVYPLRKLSMYGADIGEYMYAKYNSKRVLMHLTTC